jgi:hypothetical protein
MWPLLTGGKVPCGQRCVTVVEEDSTKNTYTEQTNNTFKVRFYGHRSTFRNENHLNHTPLSNHMGYKGKKEEI